MKKLCRFALLVVFAAPLFGQFTSDTPKQTRGLFTTWTLPQKAAEKPETLTAYEKAQVQAYDRFRGSFRLQFGLKLGFTTYITELYRIQGDLKFGASPLSQAEISMKMKVNEDPLINLCKFSLPVSDAALQNQAINCADKAYRQIRPLMPKTL